MAFKALLAFLSLQLILLLSNCCGSNPPAHFRRTGMSVKNIVITDNLTQPGVHEWTGDTAISPLEGYGIGVQFSLTYVAQKAGNWGNSAYADVFWSCADKEAGRGGSRERFTSIGITSASAFDSQHPAGALLNDLFEIRHWGVTAPVDSATGETPFANRFSREAQQLVLHLRQRPTLDSTFVFTITVKLSDGMHMDELSPKVVFRQ